MKTHFSQERITYTGEQLSSLWAFKKFSIHGNSIVSFRGPAEVREHMVDQADVMRKAYIYSEDMIHFIIELFDLNLERSIVLQRLLIADIKDILMAQVSTRAIVRSGDDLYDGDKKLSVSIATLSPVSTLIHIGVNVSSKNTPVPTKGLADYGIVPEEFAETVLQKFNTEYNSMKLARMKVSGVA